MVSACNAEAIARLDAWPRWPSGALALVGPAGAGKTHLARIWADRVGAKVAAGLDDADAADDAPLLVEDVDRAPADERLFHILNRHIEPHRGLVLTARTRPGDWASPLPDLRSRLNALPVVELAEPDDGVLDGVLHRFFAERIMRPTPDVIPYLRHRIERSVPAAEAVVEKLAAAAATLDRPVNRTLARLVLTDFADEDPLEA